MPLSSLPVSLRATLAALVMAVFAIGTALFFQHGLGYQPCAMCLWQRWAYYLGIPVLLALLAAGARLPGRLPALVLAFLAFAFLANAVLGAYHAGVEWKWWEGPVSCSGGAAQVGGNMLESLRRGQRIVACDQASGTFLGLSFAGWNVVASGAIALAAALGARAARRERA